MAMFDDPKKELEQLQKQLLEDEAWFEKELDSAKRMLGDKVPQKKKAAPRNPAGNPEGKKPAPKAAPAAKAPAKAPAKKSPAPVRNFANGYTEPEQEPAPKGGSIKALVILAAAETVGIVGIVAYWLLVLLK